MLTVTTRGVLRKSDLREANARLILNLIRRNPDLSRTDIVRMTGFAPSSVTLIVNRLMREGMVVEERGNAPAQAGRPPKALRLRPESLIAMAADISTPLSRVVTADANGRLLAERQVRWHADPAVFLGRLRDAIRSLARPIPRKRLLGVGVGIPGTVDRATGRVFVENLGWFEVEAKRILSRGLKMSFHLENSARLAALAEQWFCPPGTQPLKDFVFVAPRGGLGTGVVIDGRILRGADGEASEFGHTILYPDGRPCTCGNQGCWEQYASDRALERLYAERRGDADGEPVPSAEDIVRLARRGDAAALAALRETALYAGLGFVNLTQALQPEAILVGNYLAAAWDLIQDTVWEVVRSRVAPYYRRRLRILTAHHQEDSTLMGALALVLSRFFTRFDNSGAEPVWVEAKA